METSLGTSCASLPISFNFLLYKKLNLKLKTRQFLRLFSVF